MDNQVEWCDEKYPELAQEVRDVLKWASKYFTRPTASDCDSGVELNNALNALVTKAKE